MSDILEEFQGFEGDAVINENRHHLEMDELLRVFGVFQKNSPNFWHPFFYIMYNFGCRVSEVRIIKKESISFDRKEIVIYRLKKRTWDKEFFKSQEDAEKFIKSKFPKAEPEPEESGITSWSESNGIEIAALSRHQKKEGFSLKIHNGSKGYKRFLYKIDDALLSVLGNIQKHHEANQLTENRFLFPAMRKRNESATSARMIRIGRLKGDFAISRTNCWRVFSKACEEAEIPEALRKDHVLRHSRATLLLASGVPEETVQYLLGHENLLTTRRYLGMANELRAKLQITDHNELAQQLLSFAK